MLKYLRSVGVNITNITLISHGNALKNRRIGCVWYWWYWKKKSQVGRSVLSAVDDGKSDEWKGCLLRVVRIMLSSCSNGWNNSFRYLVTPLKCHSFPSKVPFISLESAIGTRQRCHQRYEDRADGVRGPCKRVKRTVRTGEGEPCGRGERTGQTGRERQGNWPLGARRVPFFDGW